MTTTLRVRELTDRLTTIDAVLERYLPYTYTPGTLPTDAEGTSLIELTRTAPNPATGLTVVPGESGTEQDRDGTWSAFLMLQFTTPTVNYQHALVQFRKNGTQIWSPGLPVPSSGVNVKVKIPGLVSGQAYDVTVMIVSPFGKQSVGNPVLLNQLAPFDQTPPNVVTGLVATVGVGSVISLKWDASTAADFAEFHVHRNTVDSFPVDVNGKLTAATKYAEVTLNQFSDNEVPQGTQQFYKVVASDRSENRSAGSATVNATPTGGAQGTTPGTPIAPTFNAAGPYQSSDGTTLAFVVVNLPALPSNAAMLDVLIRANGQTPWQKVDQNPTGGGTSRIDDLTPGFAYQIALRAWNNSGKASAVSGVLLHVGVGDATAPNIPTFTIDTSKLTTFTARVTSTPPADHAQYEYQIRTAASGSDGAGAGSLVKSGTFDGTLTINAADIGYGALRHLRLRDKDATGNPTTADGTNAKWTATQSFSFTKAGGGDLGDGSVTPPTLGPSAVTPPAIAPNAVTQEKLNTGDVTGLKIFMGSSSITKTIAAGATEIFDFSSIIRLHFPINFMPIMFYSIQVGGGISQLEASFNAAGAQNVRVAINNPTAAGVFTQVTLRWIDEK